jgi:succinyl-CoA:(S)-malate CoA-transferase subunit A/succinyl-CoA:(S)-malate CoA-transferase subunit B
MTPSPLPLSGVRVLDLATFLAGPFCGAILGEFGAEVIKIEQPGVGDSLRHLGTPAAPNGDTLWWLSEARNKRCITLDVRKPRGQELFRALLRRSQVLIENFRPGTLEKWGLGYDALRAENPALVLLRVSGYGQTGPKAQEPGFARIAHAFCGLSDLVGMPDGPPLMPGSTSLADYLSGVYGAVGVLLALRSAEQTGQGQVVDLGLYESMFRMLDELAPAYAKFGAVRKRSGAETFNSVPHSHYPTADGKWVAIACTNDKMFARFADVMGRPELANPDAFGKVETRLTQREEVNRLVTEWTHGRTQREVLDQCAAGEVPCGPIYNIAEIFQDPQFAARGNLLSVLDPRAGEIVVPNVVPRLSRTPGRVDHLGAALGAHNAEVYTGLLGLASTELDALKEDGVI